MPEPREAPGRTESALLFANLGGEEGPSWRKAASEARVATAARLWSLLFAPSCRLLRGGAPDAAESATWPEALGSEVSGAAFEWLDGAVGCVPWWSDAEARTLGAIGPGPEVTARVHDKAFALRFAEAEGYAPRDLRGLPRVFDSEAFDSPEQLASRVSDALAEWPAWARESFTLKPRLGSSGRGRIPGRDGRIDPEVLPGGCARLLRTGGAILEPWLERSVDLSAQLYLPPPDSGEGLLLMGALEQILTPSGAVRGHRGELDARGRVFTGHRREEALREAAAALALAARREGYWGPCGVDGFEYTGADGELAFRPLCELNARFTLGLVAVGLIRRSFQRAKAALGVQPGERVHFLFALDLPADRALHPTPATAAGDSEVFVVDLAVPGEACKPQLVYARGAVELEPLAQALRGAAP